MKHLYEVTVTDHIAPYRGRNGRRAKLVYNSYVRQSKGGLGSAGCKVVTLWRDNEVERQHQPPVTLSPKLIQGRSVRDYAYLWISGGCLLHQWCSGAIGVTWDVIEYVGNLMGRQDDATDPNFHNRAGLMDLQSYLLEHQLCGPEEYVPDQWGFKPRVAAKYED